MEYNCFNFVGFYRYLLHRNEKYL